MGGAGCNGAGSTLFCPLSLVKISRRSTSSQAEHVKVWCSKPWTGMVSSWTTCIKCISAPHARQRIIHSLPSTGSSWGAVMMSSSWCKAGCPRKCVGGYEPSAAGRVPAKRGQEQTKRFNFGADQAGKGADHSVAKRTSGRFFWQPVTFNFRGRSDPRGLFAYQLASKCAAPSTVPTKNTPTHENSRISFRSNLAIGAPGVLPVPQQQRTPVLWRKGDGELFKC